MKSNAQISAIVAEVRFFNTLREQILEAPVWGTLNVLSRTIVLLEEQFGALAESKKQKVGDLLLHKAWANGLIEKGGSPKRYLQLVRREVFRPLFAVHQTMISPS